MKRKNLNLIVSKILIEIVISEFLLLPAAEEITTVVSSVYIIIVNSNLVLYI